MPPRRRGDGPLMNAVNLLGIFGPTLFRRLHPVGSEEHRAARALSMAVGAQVDELNCWFEDQEPETLFRRLQAWNYVVFSVWPWEGHSDFAPQRWRLVEHVDAEAALASARSDVKQLEEELQKSRTAQ
jgi:hypothetical protein